MNGNGGIATIVPVLESLKNSAKVLAIAFDTSPADRKRYKLYEQTLSDAIDLFQRSCEFCGERQRMEIELQQSRKEAQRLRERLGQSQKQPRDSKWCDRLIYISFVLNLFSLASLIISKLV